MYKTTSDKFHLLKRAGNHSTRGTARGTVWGMKSTESVDPAETEHQERIDMLLRTSENRAGKRLARQQHFRNAQAKKPIPAPDFVLGSIFSA
jgi:hypothetical protein